MYQIEFDPLPYVSDGALYLSVVNRGDEPTPWPVCYSVHFHSGDVHGNASGPFSATFLAPEERATYWWTPLAKPPGRYGADLLAYGGHFEHCCQIAVEFVFAGTPVAHSYTGAVTLSEIAF